MRESLQFARRELNNWNFNVFFPFARFTRTADIPPDLRSCNRTISNGDRDLIQSFLQITERKNAIVTSLCHLIRYQVLSIPFQSCNPFEIMIVINRTHTNQTSGRFDNCAIGEFHTTKLMIFTMKLSDR